MSEYFEYRVYVGPPWRPSSSHYYDWSYHSSGDGDSFEIATVTTATLTDLGTTLTVADNSLFPADGWVWIGPGPGTTGQGWECCEYTGKSGGTQLTGLVRVGVNREHNGTHSTGASVLFWFPLDGSEGGDLSWSSKVNNTWSAKTWTASLSGVLAPKNVLRPGQSIVVQCRTTPSGLFTNFMLGWISKVTISDDHQYTAEWNIDIVSASAMIQRDESPVFTIGTVNMGRSGQAQASSTLAAPWKEAGSGDYNEAYPSFDAGNVADDQAASIWISDRYVGTGYNEAGSNTSNDPTIALPNEIMISQIHVTQPAGQAYGYQWIELLALGSKDWPALNLWIGFEDLGTIDLTGRLPALVAGDRVIICENKARFEEENPNHNAKVVISLDEMGIYGALNRPTAGGGVGLYRAGSTGTAWLHYVVWGTGYTKVGVIVGGVYTHWSPDWPGTTVDALVPNSGKTLRYIWANSTTARNNWTYDIINYPGYKIGATDAKEWVLVELPSMDLSLKADITSGFTGVTTVSKPGGDSNTGLPRSGSFTVQIGTEQMTASVSGDDGLNITARAQNGTSAVAHVAGDPVYYVDSGVATDAYLIRQIAWTHAGGTIHPKDFKIYTSGINSPRTPDEPNYTLDYSTPITVTANSAASWASSAIALRARYVLFECTLTTAAIGRVRLNDLQAIVDESTFSSATWITAGNAGDLIVGILSAIGVPLGAIYDSTTVGNLSDNTTAKGKAWTVISDITDFCGVFVDVDLMSKIRIADDTIWTSGGLIPTIIWDRSSASTPSYSAELDDGVAQATLKWRNPANTASGEVSYPASPLPIGEIKELGEAIYADGSSAGVAVQKKWAQLRFPYSVGFVAAEDHHTLTAGDVNALNWAIDPSVAPAYRIIYLVQVDHAVRDRTVTTSISGSEIERYTGEQ